MSNSKVFNDLFLTGQLTISNQLKFVDDNSQIYLENGRLMIKDSDFSNKSLNDSIVQVLNSFYSFSQVSPDNSTLTLGSNSSIVLNVDNYPNSFTIVDDNINIGSDNLNSNIQLNGQSLLLDSEDIEFKSNNSINFSNSLSDLSITLNAANISNMTGKQNTVRILSGWDNSNSLAQNNSYFTIQTHHTPDNIWNDTLYIKANKIGINTNSPSEALSVNGNIEVLNGYINLGNSNCRILNNGGNLTFRDNYNDNINLSQLVHNFVLLNDGIEVFSHFSRNSDNYFVISGEKITDPATDKITKYLQLDSDLTKLLGNIDISGDLQVRGDINLTHGANLTTLDHVQFNELTVVSDCSFNHNVNIDGIADFNNTVNFHEDIIVNKDITHHGELRFIQTTNPLQYTKMKLDPGNNDLRFSTNLFPTGVSINELFDLHGRFAYVNPFTIYTDSNIRFGSKGGFKIIDIESSGTTTFYEDVTFNSDIRTSGNLDVYKYITIGSDPKVMIYRDTTEDQLRLLGDSSGIRFDIPGAPEYVFIDSSGILNMHNFNFTGDIYKNGSIFGGLIQHFKYSSPDTLSHIGRNVSIGKPQAMAELDVSGSLMVSKDLSVEGSIYNDENVYIGFQCLGVGVGKSNPIKHLDVSGNMALTGTIVSSRNLYNDTCLDLSDNEIIFKTNNSWCHMDNDDYTLKVGNMDMVSFQRDKVGEMNKIIFNRMSKACDFIVDASGVKNAFKINGLDGKIAFGKETPRVQLDISGVDAIQLPVGSSAQRPTGGLLNGMIRYNQELNQPECYVDGLWANLASGTNFGGNFSMIYNNLNSSLVRANANDTIDLMTSNTQNMTLSHDQNRMEKKITFKDCPTEITADPSGIVFIGKIGIGDKPQFTLDISGTDGIMLPSGTVAERPIRDNLNGVIRYNNQYNIIEGHANGHWMNLANFGSGQSHSIIDDNNDTNIVVFDNDTLEFTVLSQQKMLINKDDIKINIPIKFNTTDSRITYHDNDEVIQILSDASGIYLEPKMGINRNPILSLDISANDGMRIPVGTTAQRPNIENMNGTIRYNTDLKEIEGYTDEGWVVITDTSSNTISDKDLDTNITITEQDRIDYTVDGQRRMYMDTSGIYIENPIYFHGKNSEISQNLTDNILDISGHNGIRFNNGDYIQNNRLGLNIVPRVAVDISGTDAIMVPRGTTAQRPNMGDMNGMIRYNTETKEIEGYTDEGWVVMTDTSSNTISDKDLDTNITITEEDRINYTVDGQRRMYMDTSGIYIENPIYFHGKNSEISQNLTDNILDISGQNGIRFNNEDYIQNNRLGLNIVPRVAIDISGTDAIMVPRGTTAQRPNMGDMNGMIRYNTETKEIEGYTDEGWIVMTDTSSNTISDKDLDTNITITEDDRIDYTVDGQRRMYMDTSGIYIENPIYFHGKNSVIKQDLTDNILDISGQNGIRFNNMDYIQNNRLGLNIVPRVAVDISGTDAIMVPRGTTAQRPNMGDMNGMIRYNTETKEIEGYTDEGWIVMTDTSSNVIMDGDLDTKVHINENNEIGFVSSSNEKMVIDNTGVVFKSTTLYSDVADIKYKQKLVISDYTNNTNPINLMDNRIGLGMDPRLSIDISGTDGIMVPRGTIFERPNLGDMYGVIRYNTSNNHVEGYTDKGWINMTDTSYNTIENIDRSTSILTSDINRIQFNTSGAERMIIMEDGRVSLGGVHPTNDFEVAGSSGFNGHMTLNSDMRINAKIGINMAHPNVSIDINETDAIQLPIGNNSERPDISIVKNGMIRYNSQVNLIEAYINGGWKYIDISGSISTGGGGGGGGLGGSIFTDLFDTPDNLLPDKMIFTDNTASNIQFRENILDTIGDVNIDIPTNGQTLKYDDSTLSFINSTMSLSDISDVDITGFKDGSLLQYDINNNQFRIVDNLPLTKISEFGGVITSSPNKFLQINGDATKIEYNNIDITTMTDVDFTDLSQNDLLKYDGTKWTNGTLTSYEITHMPSDLSGGENKFLRVKNDKTQYIHDTISLEDLTDVDISGVGNEEILAWNSTKNKFMPYVIPIQDKSMSDITDIVTGGAQDGQTLVFDSANGDYRFRSIPIQNKSISDITDINLSGSETDGQTLVFDVANSDYRFRSIPIQDKSVGDITDINLSGSESDGQTLVYDSANSDFRFRSIPIQNKTVSDITDITLIGTESDGQTLVYDSANGDYRFRSIPIQNKALVDITDVSVVGATSGKVLTSNGTSYEFNDIPIQNKSMNDITDVITTGAQDGQTLVFDVANSDYRFKSIPIQDKAISDITDISLSGSETDGQTLVFDVANSDYRFRSIPIQDKAISDITDITLSGSESDGQTLVFDGTNGDYRFRSIPIQDKALGDITDVDITAQDGQFMRYKASTSSYYFSSIDLNTISDVNTSGAQNGSLLTYNGATQTFQVLAPAIQNKSVADIVDINSIDVLTNEVLTFNGAAYEFSSVPRNIGELGDVNIGTPQNDNFLRYNGTSSKWELGGAATSLGALDDCNTTGVVNGHTFIYSNVTNTYETKMNSFFNLTDTPNSILGRNNHTFFVKNDGSGIESRKIRTSDIENIEQDQSKDNHFLMYSNAAAGFVLSAGAGATQLDELTDVITTGAQSGQFLKYDGTNYVLSNITSGGLSFSLNDLTDVDVSNPTNNYFLKWDGPSSKFMLASTAGAGMALNDLSDVSTNGASVDDVIKYDGTNFIASSISLGNLTDVSTTGALNNQYLKYNGTSYVLDDIVLTLGDLDNVDLTGIGSGGIIKYDGTDFKPASYRFVSLDDTPNGLSGQGGKYVRVNAGGTALEFADGTSSDMRLKMDINLLHNCLTKVNSIRAINFKYRDVSGDDNLHAGFIAQDFADVMPEVVREENGYLSLVYHEIIPLLCGAIQEMDDKHNNNIKSLNMVIQKCNKLEIQNNKLEEQNNKLEEQNNKLEIQNNKLEEQNNKLEIQNNKLEEQNKSLMERLERIEKSLNL